MSQDHSGGKGVPQTVDPLMAAGYGYGPVRRTMRDYLLILRERLWYVIVVFLVVFLASLVYTLSSTKLYTSAVSVEVLARDPVVMKVQEVRDEDIRSADDLNTQVKLMESAAIADRVAQRLTSDEAKALLAPYSTGGAGGDAITPEALLLRDRTVLPFRMTRVIQIAFTHPDPDTAAKMANYFADAFITYNVSWRVDESLRAVDDLKVRADEQAKKVQEIGNQIQAYEEKNNMVSLDQRKDIVTEKLKAEDGMLTDANARLNQAEVRWNQVQECRRNGGDLALLPFISSMGNIQKLESDIGTQKVSIADMAQRFRPKYPTMVAALQSLAQSQAELAQALNDAAAGIQESYQTALRDRDQAKAELSQQEAAALNLDRFSVEYRNLEDQLKVNQELFSNILSRMRETQMSASIESPNARIIDAAGRPTRPSSPNIAMNLGSGAAAGLFLGLTLAFVVAYIDDRVKSAYQIESVIGLPLVGIVPKIRMMDAAGRAKLVLSNAEPLAAEAFLTIHSNLRIKDETRRAKVMLVTSTGPGEGKSFVTSNLALTFAKHGERTILVDCDLRKPNVHVEFGVQNAKGVIDYCAHGTALDTLILPNQAPNFDLLVAGGQATNPTNILNDERFGRLIQELRERYDRVLVDTPPLAPVSDAMIVLPHTDGAFFTIRFNHVHISGAKFCSRKLIESNVPCFGAILNSLDLSLSAYYYAEYYDKSYRDYIGTGSAQQRA